MADKLDVIVQRMLDADEPEENIAAVIKAHKLNNPVKENRPVKSPSTWGEGVLNSVTSGEAPLASLKGLGGWIKGATIDLPSTIIDSVKTFGKLPNPLTGGIINYNNQITNPEDINQIWEGLKSTPGQMWKTTKEAGSKPFEFGEMTGQLTGQPIVTEGLSMIPGSTIAKGVRAAGKPVKAVGSVVEKHTPLSKMMPRAASIPAVEAVERGAGRGIAKIGESMQRTGVPKVLQNSEYGPVPFTPSEPLRAPTADLRGSVAYPETSVTAPEMIPNSGYGPVEFTPNQPLISRTGPQKGSVAYPEMNPLDPSVTLNNEYGPIDFQPNQPLRAPTGSNKGSVAYPELNDTPPSLIQNSQYGPTDEFINTVLAPGGRNRGGMMYPELNETPPSLMTNADYGPVEFTPDRPLISPTGPSKGGISYPELADTPPSLVPNSQAAMDEFMQSVMAPTGESRGSMYSPEMSMRPNDVVMNNEYGPVEWTPPPEPVIPEAIPYSGPIEGKPVNPWGEADNVSFGGPNFWDVGSGEKTAIINPKPKPTESIVTSSPEVVDDAYQLGDISNMDTAFDVGLDKADIINPRGPGYVKQVLNQASPGRPGFTMEGDKLIYRGLDGTPVGVATVKGNTIIDFAVDKTKGLLAGRAAKTIGTELKKLGISKVEGGMTPDAQNFLNRMGAQ